MSRGIHYSLRDFLTANDAQVLGGLADSVASTGGDRVLLTRARPGVIIWVPPGAAEDSTRDAGRFARVHELLRAAGVPELPNIEGAHP